MSENGKLKKSPAVVVGVDGSAGSNEALRWAHAEARLRKARLRTLHRRYAGYPSADAAADAQQAAEAILEKAMAELGEVDDVEVERVIVPHGLAAQALIDAVSEQDLWWSARADTAGSPICCSALSASSARSTRLARS